MAPRLSGEQLTALEEATLTALRRQSPLGEYELIRILRQTDCQAMPQGSLLEPLNLFRAHFLSYHILYRLRERLWTERSAHLVISPLAITLQPYQAGAQAVAEHDPLREVYMNLGRLQTTTAEDVWELLGKFWTRFNASEQRRAALNVLGLDDPVDYAAIKRRYRQLAMQYHPDRGGDAEQLQAIHKAMDTLKALYRT